MCGICGIYDATAGSDVVAGVLRMTEEVCHRGPDDSGLMATNTAGELVTPRTGSRMDGIVGKGGGDIVLALGHRRLSIIDLSQAAHQPMVDGSGRYWLVYNGEIYNYLELRNELVSAGCRFRSSTDSEVVLSAFIQWGPDCLVRFNGMFAFAVYDMRDRCVFLARDRFGVKPLYYLYRPEYFAFGSEIKQLRLLQSVSARLNWSVMSDFLLWGLGGHTAETFLDGIRALPGGHYLHLSREDLAAGRAEERRYWQPVAERPLPPKEAALRFRDLLEDAVRLRLRSDVPVGVTLSGGLDSSSIACLAAQVHEQTKTRTPLRAFTAEFQDQGYSEAQYARRVLAKTGIEGTIVHPSSATLCQDWPRFVRAMEEPFDSLSYYANWTVYRSIREHKIPVILNGQGGDELLLGYDRYRAHALRFLWQAGRLRELIAAVEATRRHSTMGLARQALFAGYFLLPGLRARRRRRMVRPFVRSEFFEFGRRREEHLRSASTFHDLSDLLVREFDQSQLQHLVHHEDRVSMDFSIESRTPFLDYRLFNFVLGQDISLLFHDGWSKHLLREAMAGILPEEVRTRRDKMGYDTPTGQLIRDNQPHFEGLLARNADDEIVDAQAVTRALARGVIDENLLCSIVTYLSWKELFAVHA